MRYIQQAVKPGKEKKAEKPREMPKAGGYSVKDLQSPGVRSGVWEKKDG